MKLSIILPSRNISLGVPFVRLFGNKFAARLISLLFGIYVSDLICGFRAKTKKAYKKYGPFIGTRDYVMEYDLWLKLGKAKMPNIVNECLSNFRLTMENVSATQFKNVLTNDFRLVKNIPKIP